MRILVAVPAIFLAGLVLSGCVASTAPVGVLPRDPVPPPPSVAGRAEQRPTAGQRTDAAAQRRGLSVPGQAARPRP